MIDKYRISTDQTAFLFQSQKNVLKRKIYRRINNNKIIKIISKINKNALNMLENTQHIIQKKHS